MLTSVPQELIEHILVLAARDGDPTTVAALAQTCKHFNSLLGFRSDNRHLWRELFLAVFDDPPHPEDYHWQNEFVKRMQASRNFKRWTASGDNVSIPVDDQEQVLLLQSLRTLVTSITTENSTMSSDVDGSMGDIILFDAPLSDTHLSYPLVIVLHTLEAQREARRSSSSPSDLDGDPGRRLLFSIKSPTSAWAEQLLSRGYPTALADRLLVFDPWAHRRPRRRNRRKRKGKGKGKNIVDRDTKYNYDHYSRIVTDPEWERTESGRLFYKLVLMKGYLIDQTERKKQARMLARRRVYDMRYLSRARLFGPFLPVNQTVSYGYSPPTNTQPKAQPELAASSKSCLDNESKPSTSRTSTSTNDDDDDDNDDVPPLEPISSDSDLDSDDEEGGVDEASQLHLNMLTLLSAGIHPHLLLHHHLVHHGVGPFIDLHDLDLDQDDTTVPSVGDPGGGGTDAGGDATRPIVSISPHKIIPDYAFLAAARLLIEMNMKDAWGNIHDEEGNDNEDEDEDEDDNDNNDNDDIGDEDEDEGWDEYEEAKVNDERGNASASLSPSSHANPHTHFHISTLSPEDEDEDEDDDNEHTNQDPHLFSHFMRVTRRWVKRLVDAFSRLDFVRMGGAVGYWKGSGGVKGRWEARRNGKGEEEVDGWDWAGVEGEWRRVVCWMDYQDLLLHSSGRTGNLDPDYEIDEAIRLFPVKLHITGYSSPPPRPIPPSSSFSSSSSSPSVIQDESTDRNSLIWHLPVIHFAGESRLNETGAENENESENGNGDAGMTELIRRVKGTVRMIGDEAIRWTMTSSRINHDSPEWSMEGVQVGCIGSAVGVVGMWTGVDHVRGDPIGPCWQWKVA